MGVESFNDGTVRVVVSGGLVGVYWVLVVNLVVRYRLLFAVLV